jgi:hypothetical protein
MDACGHMRPCDPLSYEDPAVPNIFSVIGENENDPDRLLLLGTDGQHYQYQLLDGTTSPVDLDEHWVIDSNAPPVEEVVG